ncbi:MAG: SIR2 family protein [Candidatus Helarchaeota archaeon]|nr:SIR2 family protein [Candidatus Helarchaeota archaeon]
METEKILFTGAGFTHNFGAPLAKGMWYLIFNHEQVQAEPRVKNMLLKNIDYESTYYSIMESDYDENEKSAIRLAVAAAYEKLDNIVRNWGFRPDSPYPVNIYKVQKLIDIFSRVNKKGFFFTINQDIFVERHYYNGQRPIIPGIQHKQEWFSSLFNTTLKQKDYSQLPTKNYIDSNKEKILSISNFFYIKLHGSQNWLSSTGNQQMVIGRGKAKQLSKEPLLSWYFEIFKDVILQQNRSLLIIGYGFRDNHINRIISEAVEKHDLKIYIISPQPIEFFKKAMNKSKYRRKILIGLSGYYPYTLLQMFPPDQSRTQFYQDVREHFFGLR